MYIVFFVLKKLKSAFVFFIQFGKKPGIDNVEIYHHANFSPKFVASWAEQTRQMGRSGNGEQWTFSKLENIVRFVFTLIVI